jgi:biopolymer transport protein ExbD
MIRLGTRRRARVDVAESGALSDIAFLLIIFFIVIAVFNINIGFLLGLPRPNAVTTVMSDDLMRVSVSAENALTLDGRTVEEDELRAAVLARRQRRPNMTLVVTLDPEATYQALVSLVELARMTDVDNFSFRMAEQ